MVLTAAPTRAARALVVPDEQTWTVNGIDPAALGLEPTTSPALARRVLAPARVPSALAERHAALLELLPSAATIESRELPLPDSEAADPLPAAGAHDHEMHGGHDHEMHGGHDHHDMMAIVGEPSADGLVMEPIELRHGPLATALPGGVLIEATLDGDVVAEAQVHALLTAAGRPAGSIPTPPDALAPVAWAATIAEAGEEPGRDPVAQWRRIAAVERERAVSHLAWLRAFARLLDWGSLTDRVTAVLGALRETPDAAADAAADLAGTLERSRPLRWRTAGRGEVSAEAARRCGLSGPNARASGVGADARIDDPRYANLGFEPLVRADGDARARTLLRAAEVKQSLALADVAVAMAAEAAPVSRRSDQAVIEGPRGPLRAHREADEWRLEADGADAACGLAAESAIGEEWASALVVLASFDLSPWTVLR